MSKSDPNKLLQGRGKTVRHAVLNTVADFDRAKIAVLIGRVLPDVTVMFRDAGGATVSISTGISSVVIVPLWVFPLSL